MRRLALTLAVLALTAGAVRAEAAERRVPAGWLGVTVDGPVRPDDDAEWDRMASAGVETVRTAFFWALLQPQPPAAGGASFDFGATDAIVTAAARRHLSLLPILQWPPGWAAVQPAGFASPPANPGDVKRVFQALVERYGPAGSLWDERPRLPREPIRAWQVFNEPNLVTFWSVRPFARDYVATLRAAARGVRGSDPGATVVLAGLPNASWKALRAVYAAGARGSFDAVALHPYTLSPVKVLRIVRYARTVMRRNGDGRLPVWITEFSWPAARGRLPSLPAWASLTDAQQAGILRQALRRFAAAREHLRIARVMWYTWLSSETGAAGFDYSGLRRIRAGSRRSMPALRVFRRWARRHEGCRKASGDARRCA